MLGAMGRGGLQTLAALAVLAVSVTMAQPAARIPGARQFCPLAGVDDYATELCKCKSLSRYCNPYCLGTYIQCGGFGNEVTTEIKQCPDGTLFSFYTQECEAQAADAPGICPGANISDVLGGQGTGNDIKPCDVPFCACDSLAPGNYPNPFDASLSSFLVCEFIPGLPDGVKSQIKAIVECPAGQIYSSTAGGCQDAPADAPPFVRTNAVACNGIECYCRGRKRGLYGNPWDSDRATALRCNSKGVLVSMLATDDGKYFNGRRFVNIPPEGLPPTCVLDSAGIRGTGRGLKAAWEQMKAADSVPPAAPFPRGSPPPSAVLVLNGTTLPGRSSPPAAPLRKLLQSPLSDCPGANYALGCGVFLGDACWITRGNPCVGQGTGLWLIWRCTLLRCGGQCPVLAGSTRLTADECASIGGKGVTIYIG